MVTSFNEGDWQNDFTREKKLHKEKKFYKISLQVRETNKKYHTRVFLPFNKFIREKPTLSPRLIFKIKKILLFFDFKS